MWFGLCAIMAGAVIFWVCLFDKRHALARFLNLQGLILCMLNGGPRNGCATSKARSAGEPKNPPVLIVHLPVRKNLFPRDCQCC
jgi:hypothetical protein